MAAFRATLQEALYFFFALNHRWPTRAEWDRIRHQQFNSTSELKAYIGKFRDGRRDGWDPVPSWIVTRLRPELGANAGYLAIPEVAFTLFKAAARNVTDPTELQAMIQNTAWWRRSTESQRSWQLAPQAEKDAALNRTAAWVMEQLYSLFGRDYASSRGWGLTDERVRTWATQIASGRVDQNVWMFTMRQKAERIDGSPARLEMLEEGRRARAPEVAMENIRGELETLWRDWMGNHVNQPNLSTWARNIYENRNSQQDFIDFLREQSASLYPTKPPNITYAQWTEPARQVVQETLELGQIDDNDPLILSYTSGQLPSLADLAERARRDGRYRNTERARSVARNTGFELLKSWGFA